MTLLPTRIQYIIRWVAFHTLSLPSKVSFKDDVDDEIDDRRASQHEAWADQVEDIWNEILIADSRAGRPRVTLPGFPIEVKRKGRMSALS